MLILISSSYLDYRNISVLKYYGKIQTMRLHINAFLQVILSTHHKTGFASTVQILFRQYGITANTQQNAITQFSRKKVIETFSCKYNGTGKRHFSKLLNQTSKMGNIIFVISPLWKNTLVGPSRKYSIDSRSYSHENRFSALRNLLHPFTYYI